MTDLCRYSNSVISTADLEVHSRYAYDGAARIASITQAKSEIVAGQAWNGTSVLPASITPSQTIAAYQLSYDRNNRLRSFASYADRFRTAYVYEVTDQLASATSSTIAGLATANPLPTTEWNWSFRWSFYRIVENFWERVCGLYNLSVFSSCISHGLAGMKVCRVVGTRESVGNEEAFMTNQTNILPNVSVSGLKTLANAMLVPKTHAKLDDLLARNADGELSEQELDELDSSIQQVDELNLLKARAEYTLRHQDETSGS